MINVFIGFDPRQSVTYNVLQYSIIKNSSVPVSITPLIIHQLPINRVGLTSFTYTRFLSPYLCGYKGVSIFLDSDMLFLGDISDLVSLFNKEKTIMVCRSQKKFEWSSLIMFNNEKCTMLTKDFVSSQDNINSLSWCDDEQIGGLPSCWNHLVGYDNERIDAKVVHFTQGAPCFYETCGCEYSEEWVEYYNQMVSADSWTSLMGNSVHAAQVNNIKVPKLMVDESTKSVKKEYKDKVNHLLEIYNKSK